jgi:hypothetical protein
MSGSAGVEKRIEERKEQKDEEMWWYSVPPFKPSLGIGGDHLSLWVSAAWRLKAAICVLLKSYLENEYLFRSSSHYEILAAKKSRTLDGRTGC